MGSVFCRANRREPQEPDTTRKRKKPKRKEPPLEEEEPGSEERPLKRACVAIEKQCAPVQDTPWLLMLINARIPFWEFPGASPTDWTATASVNGKVYGLAVSFLVFLSSASQETSFASSQSSCQRLRILVQRLLIVFRRGEFKGMVFPFESRIIKPLRKSKFPFLCQLAVEIAAASPVQWAIEFCSIRIMYGEDAQGHMRDRLLLLRQSMHAGLDLSTEVVCSAYGKRGTMPFFHLLCHTDPLLLGYLCKQDFGGADVFACDSNGESFEQKLRRAVVMDSDSKRLQHRLFDDYLLRWKQQRQDLLSVHLPVFDHENSPVLADLVIGFLDGSGPPFQVVDTDAELEDILGRPMTDEERHGPHGVQVPARAEEQKEEEQKEEAAADDESLETDSNAPVPVMPNMHETIQFLVDGH
jgi:hypothetical protein